MVKTVYAKGWRPSITAQSDAQSQGIKRLIDLLFLKAP